MRSDLTAAALIRAAAMRLFADRGAAAVSVRDIAAEAGVSPSLVIHHYGSKNGLKAAVDAHVTAFFTEFVTEFIGASADELMAASTSTTLAERIGNGPVLAYLRRLLVDGGPAAAALFGALYDMSLDTTSKFEDAGIMRCSSDDRTRAAVLLANDLAVVLLREQITAVLGTDPLSGDGLVQWSQTVMDVYMNGVLSIPDVAKAEATPRPGSRKSAKKGGRA